MSAAGRVVLCMLSAFIVASIVASLMSRQTATDAARPRTQAQQEAPVSNPPSSMTSPQMAMDVGGPREQAQQEGQVSNPPPSVSEPTVVTMAERPAGHSVPLGQPLAPSGSEAIARELQKELKRVGCYGGHLNGEWTRSTREAMKAFSDRVNAKLPIDKPDSILLALVQGHSEKVCGVPCPSGQGLSHTQQCTPNALLARSGRTKLTAASGQGPWTVKTIVSGEASGEEGTRPSDIAPDKSPSTSAGHERALQRGARRHLQPTPRREGSWASSFFKQRDRFSLN